MAPRRSPRDRQRAPEATPEKLDPRALVALLPRYLEWMRVQNYSPFSVEQRSYDLRRFVRWSEERGVLRASDVTPGVLEDYKRHLFHRKKRDGRALSRKTQAHLLVSVLELVKWMVRRGFLLSDPGSLIEIPRYDRTLPIRALTPQEIEQILGAVDVTQPLGLRDRAILEMAYSTGMRRLELAHVKLEDVDAGRGTVMVRQGKGRKDRVVPIGARALQWLDKYIEEVRPFYAHDEEVHEIFVTRFGTPMRGAALTTVGRRCREQAGVTKHGSMHVYRHSAATGMLEGGADIRVIQEYLGHAHLSSTQVYTQLAIQTVKAVHERTHPAERPIEASSRVAATDGEPEAPATRPELEAEAALPPRQARARRSPKRRGGR